MLRDPPRLRVTLPRRLSALPDPPAPGFTRGNRQSALVRIAQMEKLRSSDVLGRADRAHYPFLWQIRNDPLFDSIHSDQRYAQLLAKMNLIPAPE